jgi:antitoxin MazE
MSEAHTFLERPTMENQTRVHDIKLVSIGNSKGIRIPKRIIEKYGLKSDLLLEETERGLLLRQKEENMLSWEETYKAIAEEAEDWDDFDVTILDGLDDGDVDA